MTAAAALPGQRPTPWKTFHFMQLAWMHASLPVGYCLLAWLLYRLPIGLRLLLEHLARQQEQGKAGMCPQVLSCWFVSTQCVINCMLRNYDIYLYEVQLANVRLVHLARVP